MISKHAPRNALIPVVTIVGFEIGVLIGGAAIVESIFGCPASATCSCRRSSARLPRHPGDDADDRVHLHLRNLLVDILYGARPEDLAGMSPRDRSQPASRPRPWPTRSPSGGDAERHGVPRQVAQPDRPRRRGIILFNVFVALFGPLLWTVDPTSWSRCGFEDPSWAHPMGTDELGRDTLARIIHGAQVSLYVGAISVSIAFVGGTCSAAGRLLQGDRRHGADVRSSTSCSRCPDRPRDRDRRPARPELPERDDRDRDRDPARFARVVRGAVLEVMATRTPSRSRALGASGWRIMMRHVIPNIGAPLLVLVTVYLSVAILAEAAPASSGSARSRRRRRGAAC